MPSLPFPLAMLTVMRLFDASMRELDVFARYPVPFAELDRDAVAAEIDRVPLRIVSLPQRLHAQRRLGHEHDRWHLAACAARDACPSAPQS